MASSLRVPNEYKDVLVFESEVDLHCLVILPLVGEEGGEGAQQWAVVRLKSRNKTILLQGCGSGMFYSGSESYFYFWIPDPDPDLIRVLKLIEIFELKFQGSLSEKILFKIVKLIFGYHCW